MIEVTENLDKGIPQGEGQEGKGGEGNPLHPPPSTRPRLSPVTVLC